MKIPTVAGTMSLSGEPPRSTAYYYADLERLKRKNNQEPIQETSQNQDELSEYVEANEVVNEGAIREIPPFRDRRQFSLPEYNAPDTARKDTYSTAGTFPMPEPKEKEPLLAELEVVGRLPLSQLDSSVGVRRSRSWYLCCPNIGDEEISRESSWRYSSLRPVTAPPVAGQNGINILVATEGSGREDLSTLRAERDALARALAAERQRAATAARAHDARLAELHGVIAELVRRRAQDKHARAIPEEEMSDECESTTQPAGELDNDADRSRTEQNDTSSALSPAELPTPQESKVEPQELPEDTSDTTTQDIDVREEQPRLEVTLPVTQPAADNCDTSLNLSEKDSEVCLTTARCGLVAAPSGGGSCSRQHSPAASALYTHSTGRCESRQAKVASRVRLKKTEDSDSNNQLSTEEAWCTEAAERLALDVCAQADLREALVAANNDGSSPVAWRARAARLEAQLRVLQCALARATDTAHRLYSACAVQESTSVSLCCALRAADRALETYDVLLALAETQHADNPEREAAELVARQLLARLEMEQSTASIGEPLLSPGPWLQHHNHSSSESIGARSARWSARCEARLRAHAARLKADTAALRTHARPELFSFHDIDEDEISKTDKFSMSDMEAAVALEEALLAAEMKANQDTHKSGPLCSRRRRERHWLETQASETDL